MKLFFYSVIISGLIILSNYREGSAQDLHFSQYFNSPLTTNPANTGFIPDANYRIGVNYRNQWSSIPVPYKTMSAFGDVQLLRDRLNYGWLGVGGVILRDEAGSGDLTSNKIYGSIAYHQLLGLSSLLSAGFNIGIAQKSINLSKLTFGDQWNGKFFDASSPTLEYGAIKQTSIMYFDLQAGLNYAYFPNDNIYINAGVSVHHINTPHETFYNGNNEIDRRYIGFINSSFMLLDNLIINPSAYYTTQAGAQELVFGAYLSCDLSGDGSHQLLGGAYYRWNDAAIPMVGYQINNIRMMFSYDVTTSSFSNYTKRNGAYELSLIYLGLFPNHSYTGDEKKFRCPHF